VVESALVIHTLVFVALLSSVLQEAAKQISDITSLPDTVFPNSKDLHCPLIPHHILDLVLQY
jgi:hypothetical protein